MSLILDALKKSEDERKRQLDEGAAVVAPNANVEEEVRLDEKLPKSKLTLVFGGVGALMVGGAAVFFLMPSPDEVPNRTVQQEEVVAVEPKPVIKEESKLVVKTETEPKPAAIAEPEPVIVAEAEPVVVTESEQIVIVEPEPVVIVEPEPAVIAEPEPVVIVEPEPAVIAEPEPVVIVEPELEPEPETIVVAKSEPEPVDEIKPEPEVIIEPEPEVIAITIPRAKPVRVKPKIIEAEVIPEPAKQPTPESVPAAVTPAVVASSSESYKTLMSRAQAFAEQGLYSQSVADYTQAIIKKPKDVDAHFGRAWTHEESGDHEKAISGFNEVIKLRPKMSDAYFGRGWSHEQIIRHDLAIDDYSTAIALDRGFFDAYFSRGVLRFYGASYGQAQQDFEAVFDNEKGSLQQYAFLWLSLSAMRSGNPRSESMNQRLESLDRSGWLGSIIDLYAGETSIETVIEAINTGDTSKQRERECVGYFFLGQFRLVSGDLKGAEIDFEKVMDSNAKTYRQYTAAQIELARLN